MKLIKFNSVLLIVLLTLIFSSNVYSAETLVFNTQSFAPFSYLENDKVAGPVKDVIEAVCKEAGFKAKFNLYPWKRAQELAKKGKANGLFVLGWNKPREEWLYFSHPVLNTEYGLFFSEDNKIDFKSVDDLKGKKYTISVYGPSNTSKKLEKIAEQVGDIKVDMGSDSITGFKKLSKKRVDAVYSNRDVGNALVKQNNLKNIRYGGTERKLKYYIGLLKNSVSEKDYKAFNNAYKKLYDSGAIKKILDGYDLEISPIE